MGNVVEIEVTNELSEPKMVGIRSQVRQVIQASIFKELGFDVGRLASGAACDAVFEELTRLGISPPEREYWVYEDPIEQLRAEPFPPEDDAMWPWPSTDS